MLERYSDTLNNIYGRLDVSGNSGWYSSPYADVPQSPVSINSFGLESNPLQAFMFEESQRAWDEYKAAVSQYRANPIVVSSLNYRPDFRAIRNDPHLFVESQFLKRERLDALADQDFDLLKRLVDELSSSDVAALTIISVLAAGKGEIDFSELEPFDEKWRSYFTVENVHFRFEEQSGLVIPEVALSQIDADVKLSVPAVALLKGFWTNYPTASVVTRLRYEGRLSDFEDRGEE